MLRMVMLIVIHIISIAITSFVIRSNQIFGIAATEFQSSQSSRSPYHIILDGGSTGSRLHLYEFRHSPVTNVTSCHRRLSTRVETPISSFALHPNTSIAQHLLPLFYRAADVVPARYHSSTRVHYKATAGMRLLPQKVQEQMYDALYDGLMEDEGFVFGDAMERDNLGTLKGSLEAFYGAVSANYLEGYIDSTLRLMVNDVNGVETLREPLGALDMGGASMQIVFFPDPCDGRDSNTSPMCAEIGKNVSLSRLHLRVNESFSESYLSYGVDQFRERMWNKWILDSQMRLGKGNIIFNPCFFEGYTTGFNGYKLIGTGNADECGIQIRRLIQSMKSSNDTSNKTMTIANTSRKLVGGIEHPPIKGKFIAMALFYFSLDCLRELSNNDALSLSWPTPTVEELSNALDGLCSRKWHNDLEEIKHNSHVFTSASVLPHRCFESVYMVTILRDVFHFHPQSRDITFTYLVNGSEAEWSLGMALSLYARENQKTML